MRNSVKVLLTIISASATFSAIADNKKIQHFPALESPTVESAFCNLQTYNKKLEAILNKEEITTLDMVKVHELTYTLENALSKLNETLEQTAVSLEEVHLGSEDLKDDVIKQQGRVYMDGIQALMTSTSCLTN